MRIFLGLGFAAFLAMPAAADILYKCKLGGIDEPSDPKSYALFIQYDGTSDQAQTWDAFSYEKGRDRDPGMAKVKHRSDGTLFLTWQQLDVRKESATSDISYRVALSPADGAVDFEAVPTAYPSSWHYTGHCITEKVK